MPRSKAKTTKGDGMERRARNYLKAVVGSDYESETEELPRLIRLLRKVAREAEKRGSSPRGCCFTSTPMACPIHDRRSA